MASGLGYRALMSDTTFFWHDYETFGLSPRRDRPAQFAGVRTDAALNEIGDPVMWYCRPAPDYLPSPEACLLTGITPQQCLQHGMPEHAFADAIERELARPGTIGVGYNSIRFDDEVTRFLFWRSLRDPYAREWQNDCSRWDLLDVVRCTYALRPEGIQWPQRDDGLPSFKLEHLTQANGLQHEAAHDALSDVRATVALARLIRARQPKLFDFCLRLRKKDAVIAEIGAGKPFLHVSGRYGVERGCLALVMALGPHPTNRNEVIVWDLAHDPAQLAGLDAQTVRTRLFTPATALGDEAPRLPIKTIHLNKSPIVIGNLRTLGPERAQHWGIDVARSLQHAQTLIAQGPLSATFWADVFVRPQEAALDVDEDLYGGFTSPADRRRLATWRAQSPQEMGARLPAFDDARLAELCWRYRARNFPEGLTADERAQWQAHCAARLQDGEANARTFTEYFEQLDTLNENADEAGQALLEALYDYAECIAPAG